MKTKLKGTSYLIDIFKPKSTRASVFLYPHVLFFVCRPLCRLSRSWLPQTHLSRFWFIKCFQILKEFQSHLMYLSLKFLASILIKVIEEFCIVWLNSSLFFFWLDFWWKNPISGLMAEIQLLGLFPFFLISLQSAMKQASRMLNDEFERFFLCWKSFSQNLTSLTQKTNIWHNNAVSRRFGR